MRLSSSQLVGFGLAGCLAAGAAFTAYDTKRINDRHVPRGRVLEIDGVRLHFLDEGAGQPVVLLHGNAVTAEDWRASGVMSELARKFRVIVPDRPGYGHSERPKDRRWTAGEQAKVIAQLLRTLQAPSAVVVGHSLGTQVALRLALDHSPSVARLVLLSGYYFPTPRLDSLTAGLLTTPGLGSLIRRTVGQPLGRAMTKTTLAAMFAPQDVPKHFSRAIFEMSLRPTQMRAGTADGHDMLREAAALEQRLPGLTSPCTVLAGEADHVVDYKTQSVRLAAVAPNTKLELIAESGHMIHHANTAQVVAAIAQTSAPRT